jgi:aminoglycoside phosphotransferase (APT) family kinase protein
VEDTGRLLASGRDADIFEYGNGAVLRRSRAGQSLAKEARLMKYLGSEGYPVPTVQDLSDDGTELVMERIEGRSMGNALSRTPWMLRRQARVLAELHRQLHELSAPEFLDPAPVGQGDHIVHLDLHPQNVILSPKGPVVIDWTNAARGNPTTDVGLVWVLVSTGEIPDNPIMAKLHHWGRSLFANAFLRNFDREGVSRQLRDIVAWKTGDSHMSQREITAMWAMVESIR